MYFLHCGAQNCSQYSRWLLTQVSSFSIPKYFLYIRLWRITHPDKSHMEIQANGKVQRVFTSKGLSANNQSKSNAWRKKKAFPLSSEALENDQWQVSHTSRTISEHHRNPSQQQQPAEHTRVFRAVPGVQTRLQVREDLNNWIRTSTLEAAVVTPRPTLRHHINFIFKSMWWFFKKRSYLFQPAFTRKN